MLLTLDLNELESKKWHEYIQWLDYMDGVKGYEDATTEVKVKLADLIYQVWERSYGTR